MSRVKEMKNASLIKLNSAIMKTTHLKNVIVKSPVEISLDYETPICNTQYNRDKILVWEGLTPSPNLKKAVYEKEITHNQSSGSLIIHDENLAFNQGAYTIGYCVGSDATSVSATVNILNGQVLQYQETALFLLNQVKTDSGIVLTIAYQTPVGTTPRDNLDWIEIFAGDKPKSGHAGYLKHFSIQSNHNSDTMQLHLDLGQLKYEQPYIIEYNPGHSSESISATYNFQFAR